MGNTPQQELNFSPLPAAQIGQGYPSRTSSESTALKHEEHRGEHLHL